MDVNKIICGDALEVLRDVPDGVFQTCVTSPPYWGLRDYGVEGQLGLEPSPEEYIENMVAVFREVWRVLREDGVVFLNLGDSYQDKQLQGIPWRVALALQADGWWLRNDIIWHKPAPMPESVTDRCTKGHEYIFLLAKSKRYFYDHEAIKEESEDSRVGTMIMASKWSDKIFDDDGKTHETRKGLMRDRPYKSKRNKRTVWTIPTKPFSEAHFACVDEQTEALTLGGWKQHSELTDGDLIASYNSNIDKWYWQPATFHRYDFNWKMIQIEKRETSQRLTPEHRCPVRRKMGHQGRDGWGFDVVMAHQLQPQYELLLSADYGLFPSEGIGIMLAALLGWFVTDGNIGSHGAVNFYQSQSANGWKCDRIRKLLDGLGAEYTERTCHREWNGRPSVMINWHVTGKLAERLKELAPDRELIPRMTELPEAEARALFEAIVDGDGCRRDDGRLQIVQKSEEHIDAMQILAVRLGYKTIVSRRAEYDVYQLYITEKKWLTLRGTGGTHEPLPTIDYKGTVWCPSVGTGLWVARREGKVFITGNTFPPDLVKPCIKAGTSKKGRCPECGAPWKRVVERTVDDKLEDRPYCGNGQLRSDGTEGGQGTQHSSLGQTEKVQRKTTGWRPTCDHDTDPVPCLVLDPFVGSGTTCKVAVQLKRNYFGIDLSEEYCEMARQEIEKTQPALFTW